MQNSKTPNQTNKNNLIFRGKIDENALEKAVYTVWQGYMDEDRTFYSVNENTILETRNV